MTPEHRPGDTIEQSFCRQRTDEEQAAIEYRTTRALYSGEWRFFAEEAVVRVMSMPGAILGRQDEGR